MAGLLTQYLRESCGRAFAWGRDDDLAVDCFWWGVGWVERARGAFAQPLREKYLGRYRNARECARLARDNGGLEAVYGEIAAAAGLEPTDSPTEGDLVAVRRQRQLMLGIMIGDRVAVRAECGLAFLQCVPVAAWRV